MLTIKIIQDGVTTITEREHFNFHGKDSAQLKEALELVKDLGIPASALNSIYYVKPTFSDEECTQIYTEERILFSKREKNGSEVVGVLVDVEDAVDFDGGFDIDESIYTVITESDRIYVMNDQGKTIFSV